MNKSIKVSLKLLICLLVSTLIVAAVNITEIRRVTGGSIIVTPETYSNNLSLAQGQIVQIEGTPDLLNTVSLEGRNNSQIFNYFTPLKEYGIGFVVQAKKSQLTSTKQTFTGEIIGLIQTPYDTRIRAALNKPVTLSDPERVEFDSETIKDLEEQTTNSFTSATWIVQDGVVPSATLTWGNIAFWSTILTIVIATVFRKRVFSQYYKN